jgi:cytochrome c2
LLGRKIGSDNFRYSAALRTKDAVWTEKSLRDFISDPNKFATGTGMPNLHLSQDELDIVLQDLQRSTSASLAKGH